MKSFSNCEKIKNMEENKILREEKIKKLIETAKSLIGRPYEYGAYLNPDADKRISFDCSSFIKFIFGKVGVELPRSTILQAAAPGIEVPGKSDDAIMPGDVIFFEGNIGHYRHDLFPGRKIFVGHAGIFIGDNRIIHATNNPSVSGVVEQSLGELPVPPYNIVLIKRFL